MLWEAEESQLCRCQSHKTSWDELALPAYACIQNLLINLLTAVVLLTAKARKVCALMFLNLSENTLLKVLCDFRDDCSFDFVGGATTEDFFLKFNSTRLPPQWYCFRISRIMFGVELEHYWCITTTSLFCTVRSVADWSCFSQQFVISSDSVIEISRILSNSCVHFIKDFHKSVKVIFRWFPVALGCRVTWGRLLRLG